MNNRKQDENRARGVSVVRYTPSSLKGEVLAPRGSIVVYLAAAGSERLDAIHAAARGGYVRDKLLGEVDDLAGDAAAKVSLHYGDRLLAADIPVPADGRAVRLILPYNGGELIPEDLVVSAQDPQGTVAAVAVVHDPPLSRIEQAALLLVPHDRRHLSLGAALPGGIAGTNDEERRRQDEENRRAAEEARAEQQQAAGEARAEAAEARAEARAQAREEARAAGGRIDIHILDRSVITMGPALAAAELLELRRDILLG